MTDLRLRFRGLLWRHVGKPRVCGNKVTGLAPCHNDSCPSFSADLEKGVWFCHACGRGGGVKDFAELVGEEWERPRLSREEIARRQARCVALEAARDAYETWAFWKLQEMADEYQQLPADGEVAESAIRAVCQHPDWFSESKVEWWEKELARIYDRLPVLEYELDLLTFTMHERERFLWWLEETDHE